jgi:hypothetical protein
MADAIWVCAGGELSGGGKSAGGAAGGGNLACPRTIDRERARGRFPARCLPGRL